MNNFIVDCAANCIVTTNDQAATCAVGYTRFSSEGQDENSTAYQTHAIIEYCKKNNIRLVKIFSDEAYTGTNDNRPSFQAMIAEANNDPVWDEMIVFDYSRFSRNVYDCVMYKRMFDDLHMELTSVKEDFGYGSAAFFMQIVKFAMNDMSSRDNSERTRDGMASKARQTFHCGGRPPLGYDLVDSHLVINEYEAECVRLIFEMYVLGYTYAKMAEVLNSRGYTTKKGLPFKVNSFDSILSQEKYIGTYVWNRASKGDSYGRHNTHKSKPIDEQVIVPDGVPAIISPEQYAQVQAFRCKTKDRTVKSFKRHHYMLTGLGVLKCAHCGANMVGNIKSTHGRTYFTYSCPNHRKKECPVKDIDRDTLNKLVAGQLAADLYRRKDFCDIVTEAFCDRRYQILKDKLKGKNAATANALKALESGYTSAIAEKLRSLHKEKQCLEEQLKTYPDIVEGLSKDEFKRFVSKFGKELVTSDEPEIRGYLKEVIESIIVDNDGVTVTLNLA